MKNSILLTGLLLGALTATATASGAEAKRNVAVVYSDRDTPALSAVNSVVNFLEAEGGISVKRIPVGTDENLVAQIKAAHQIRLAFAGEGGIAVVFPDIGEPYRGIFAKIIEGIEERTKTRVSTYAVGGSADTAELAAELRKQDVRVVIALGKHGLRATTGLDGKFDVVAGAVVSVGESEARSSTVVSLAPDPGLLFARLKSLVPDTRRVAVVYDPTQNDWLIRHARNAAKAQGFELLALPAGDLKTALKQYQDFLAGSSRGDALWLIQDSTTVDENTVLPLVLKEAWDRNLPLFSSSVAHVRRGALFSLYPNNIEMGRTLAQSALGYLGSNTKPSKGVQPLREVMAAVNTRTASHLGVNLRSQVFDLVLPEQ